MQYFNFHHHQKDILFGIYNLNRGEEPTKALFSVGIHPQDVVEDWEDKFALVEDFSRQKNCVAIGECGLDAMIHVDEKLQEEVFKRHIFLANELKKPIIIHCVRRFQEVSKFQKFSRVPMILHGFNRNKNIAQHMQKSGFYFSFGKAALQNVSLQDTIKSISLEKIFLETDAAEFNIEELYSKISQLKEVTKEQLQNIIFENLKNINIYAT